MDQCGGLERVVGRFVGHFLRSELAQLVVNQGKQFFGGGRVTLLDGVKYAGNVAHGRSVARNTADDSTKPAGTENEVARQQPALFVDAVAERMHAVVERVMEFWRCRQRRQIRNAGVLRQFFDRSGGHKATRLDRASRASGNRFDAARWIARVHACLQFFLPRDTQTTSTRFSQSQRKVINRLFTCSFCRGNGQSELIGHSGHLGSRATQMRRP